MYLINLWLPQGIAVNMIISPMPKFVSRSNVHFINIQCIWIIVMINIDVSLEDDIIFVFFTVLFKLTYSFSAKSLTTRPKYATGNKSLIKDSVLY